MKNLKSLDIGHTMILPQGQPVGIFITYKPEVLDKVGILKEIFGRIAEFGLPVVHLLASVPRPGQSIYNYIIVDAAGKEDKVKTLTENLKKLGYIENVEVYYPSRKGMLTASPFEVLTISGIRGMVWVKPMFRAFIRTFQEVIGTGGAAIIYNMGYIMGKESFQSHMRIIEGDKRGALELVKEFFKASGLGSIEYRLINVHKGEAVIRLYNSFECELFPNLGKPASQFIRGIIAGWISVFLEEEIEIEEVKCIAKGDPYCEYVAKVIKQGVKPVF